MCSAVALEELSSVCTVDCMEYFVSVLFTIAIDSYILYILYTVIVFLNCREIKRGLRFSLGVFFSVASDFI